MSSGRGRWFQEGPPAYAGLHCKRLVVVQFKRDASDRIKLASSFPTKGSSRAVISLLKPATGSLLKTRLARAIDF